MPNPYSPCWTFLHIFFMCLLLLVNKYSAKCKQEKQIQVKQISQEDNEPSTQSNQHKPILDWNISLTCREHFVSRRAFRLPFQCKSWKMVISSYKPKHQSLVSEQKCATRCLGECWTWHNSNPQLYQKNRVYNIVRTLWDFSNTRDPRLLELSSFPPLLYPYLQNKWLNSW